MDGAPLDDEALGDQPFGAPMPRNLRLSDAERIAADRLEGATEGSLKEALATMIVAPIASGSRLSERLQHVAAARLPVACAVFLGHDARETESRPVQDAAAVAAPVATAEIVACAPTPEANFGWMSAVPPAHAVPFFEEREPEQDPAPETCVAMPMTATATGLATTRLAATPPQIPVVPVVSIEAVAAVVDTSLHRAVAAWQLDALAEVSPVATSQSAWPVAEPDDIEPADADMIFSDTPESHEESELSPLPHDPNLEPIVTAYAASARLAADAAAASQALFELQKLLNDQLLEASPELSETMEAHALAGLAAIPAAGQADAATALLQAAEPVAFAPSAADPSPDPAADLTVAPPADPQAPRMRPAQQPPPVPVAAILPAALREVPPETLPKCVTATDRPAPPPPLAAHAPRSTAANASNSLARPARDPKLPVVAASVPRSANPAAQGERPRKPMPKARPRKSRATFDVRGFAAGFAFSGAIGIVLYFVMSTS